MPIEFKIDSLDGMEESISGLYKESPDGGFVLDVTNVKPLDEFSKVHDLLGKERAERKGLQEKLKAFGERTPDTYFELEDKVQELTAMTGDFNEDKINELMETKMKPVNRKMERLAQEREEAVNALSSLRNEINVNKRDSSLVEAVNGKIKPEFLTDIKLRAQHSLEYNDQMNGWFDESGLSVSEWVDSQISTTPSWRPDSQGANLKSQSKTTVSTANNPFEKGSINLTEQAKLYKSNRKEYDRLKALASK